MNNLKSYTEYAVTTPTTDFVIGFEFNYGTDAVNITVDDVPATEAGYTVIYLNSTTMQLNPAVTSGVVRLQRETNIDVPDNKFIAGAKFITSNMDENFTQIRHSQQEVRDGFKKLSDDTYEIIDTLQVVGQAAQDAADAAEQAAQTANDAAAQVNDKVSYQDLDDTVDAAIAPVRDYTALPFEVGKSYDLNARVMLANGDVVRSTVAGNTVDPNLDMAGWENPAEEQRKINQKLVGKLFSSFGATPNDIAKAAENGTALGLAIAAGGSIIFDGFYHISFSSEYVVNSDLTLIAQKKGDGFNVTSRTQPVRVGDNVNFRIDSMKIRASGVTGGLFSTVSDLTYVDAVDVINSDIDVGVMRLFSSDFSTTADPETTQYGIKRVKIIDSTITNASILFVGTNAQHELIEIKGNRLSNISNGVISFGRTNGHAYERKLKTYMKRMEAWDNTTINDDSFFATATGTYLSPVVYEGDYLEFYRNHTEGLKSRNVVSIYDVYANSTVLDYQGNTWKNNLCMNVNKINGDLLKSKGTPVSTYKNNKFILEKSFIDRHSANIDGMTWVSLFQKIYGDDSSNIIIHDNLFDVYELAGMPASQLSKNVDIRRNTFKFQRCSGIFLNVNNSNADTTTYTNADINILDNDFIIEDAGINMLRAGTTVNAFNILGMTHSTTAGKGDYRSININRNRIKIKNLHSSHYINPNGVAKFIDTSGNEVEITNLTSSTSYRSLGDLSSVKSAGRSKGNILNGALSELGLNAFLPANKPYEFSNEVNGAYRNWYTHVLAPTSNSLWVYVKIEAFAPSGKFTATYKAKLTPTGLEYTDSAGVSQTLSYPTGTTYTYVNPKVFKLSEVDEVFTGVRLGLRNADNVGGALRIDFYNTNLTTGQDVKFIVSIQTVITA